jgi:hypothetical protein
MASAAGGQFLKENAFLVAAVALPVVVVGFFLLATAVPRLRVPPPQFDLLFRANRPYDGRGTAFLLEFDVRDGRVVAVVRHAPEHTYSPRPGLLIFDHRTMEVREVDVDVPPPPGKDAPPVIVPVEALADRKVVAQTRAPDGYEINTRSDGGPGIVGELFGMRRYQTRPALAREGRVIPLELPAAYEPTYGIEPIGWMD